ncbi:MAG: hypothetical protein AMJ95_03345 [Omnitrophica WOR_2 bacterium SM23_72]|nr:MAG: hypothetical protein AMJ95_03345 [Omnitrophica WOR_2 bacterium SM23_72]
MSKTKHDQIAEKLARKFHTEYKQHKGIDIVTPDRVIEVETKSASIQQGIRQIVHSPKARYLAVNKQNIKNALAETEGTGIGIMGPSARIIKRASRKA